MNRVHIKTYGCQMNERDSEAVAAMLRARGYSIVASEAEADVVLLNTCSVRDQAEQKAIGKAGRILGERAKKLRRASTALAPAARAAARAAVRAAAPKIIGIMGCMAQNRGHSLLDSLPDLDLVAGTQKFHRVPDHLDHLMASLRGLGPKPSTIVDTGEEHGSQNTICGHKPGRQVCAYVSIMQGCDMRCSYCIVPKTRGAERARPPEDILDEVRALAANGAKEVTLLGQIVNRYGAREFAAKDGKSPFAQLLEAVDAVAGIERIRYTSPHPVGFGADLVDCHRRLPKLCEHIHLPMQSGSDRILRAMRRPHTREQFLRKVEALRTARPDMCFSTDIIVGFPGETDEDFLQTLALFDEVRFSMAYIFKYSARAGTEAEAFPEKVPEAVKEERNKILLDHLEKFSLEYNQALAGTTQEVLVEGPARKGEGIFMGRNRANRKVLFPATADAVGKLLPVRIESATTTVAIGKIAV
jgi:tRNA-2-methylthio-N6-dimethylallyladenosine synthase